MKKRRLLLYVVLDMSQSMTWSIRSNDAAISGKLPIDVAQGIIPSIIDTVKNDATVFSTLRISVIGFNQNVYSLDGEKIQDIEYDGRDIEQKTPVALKEWWQQVNAKTTIRDRCVGQTYYSTLFDELRKTILRDKSKYDANEYEIGRPVVYFLTDGRPEGNNETEQKINAAYDRLVSQPDHNAPIILVIGIGDNVSKESIGRYGAGRVTGKWEFDPEKGKKVRTFSSGEYRKQNEDMSFILKGDNQVKVLPPLNRAVVKSIIYSLNRRTSRGPLPYSDPFDDLFDPEAFTRINRLLDNEETY